MEVTKTFSGAPWESSVGYCRAIKVGQIIEVSGTTAMEGSEVIGKNDVAKQTQFIIEKVAQTLLEMGASLEKVIRTRMYTTNIQDWEKIGEVHGRFFKHIQPVTTMIEVSKLIHPDLLIEIEFTAHLDA